METEFKAIIVKEAGTGDVLKTNIRINIPEDYPGIGELVSIACCYNAKIEYVNGALVIEAYNKELASEICEDYYIYLFK